MPTNTARPIGPAAAANAASHSRIIGSRNSGRMGGASLAGRGSPGAGRKLSAVETTATRTKVHRQSTSAISPDANGDTAEPAAWNAE